LPPTKRTHAHAETRWRRLLRRAGELRPIRKQSRARLCLIAPRQRKLDAILQQIHASDFVSG
jgi:hypothetical protein